jgi:WhiB family redox-sensing transcriptional regulator
VKGRTSTRQPAITATDFMDDPARHCAGTTTDLFFSRGNGDQATAKNICRGCPVLEQCFAYAITGNETFGIWAGINFSSDQEKRKAVLALGRLNDIIHRLWTKGLSDVAIAQRLCLDTTTVRQHRLELGLPATHRGGRRKREPVNA